MLKSIRKTLTGEQKFVLSNVHQVTENLAVLSYDLEGNHNTDLFNVNSKEVMDTVLSALSGKKVEVTVVPDSSADADGHPECIAATVIE